MKNSPLLTSREVILFTQIKREHYFIASSFLLMKLFFMKLFYLIYFTEIILFMLIIVTISAHIVNHINPLFL